MKLYNPEEVENVLLFTGGLDSVLSYIRLKKDTPKLELLYVPIHLNGSILSINGEMATIKLLSRPDGLLDHKVAILGRHAEFWALSWRDDKNPSFVPFKYPGLVLLALINYRNLKNVYVGGTAEDGVEFRQMLKNLQKAYRESGADEEFSVKSAFNWREFKHDIIKDIIESASDPRQVVTLSSVILQSFSSEQYLNMSVQKELAIWFSTNIPKMSLVNREIATAVMALATSKTEIPSFSRRSLSGIEDLEWNVAIYNGLGVVFPFRNMTLLNKVKEEALSPDSEMLSKQRNAIIEYAKALEKIQISALK